MKHPEQRLYTAGQHRRSPVAHPHIGRDATMARPRFCEQRIFHVDDPNGKAAGWYIEVRDDYPQGPFLSRRMAEVMLVHYIGALQKTRSW